MRREGDESERPGHSSAGKAAQVPAPRPADAPLISYRRECTAVDNLPRPELSPLNVVDVLLYRMYY